MRLLIVVDYQYDFVADDGKLTCGKAAQDIEDALYKKVKEYLNNGDDVVFTYDTHMRDTWESHPEQKLFPIHCIPNHKGSRYFGKLSQLENKVEQVYKRSYGMPIKRVPELILKRYDSIEFAGVATNICVYHNLLFFYNEIVNTRGDTKLIVDANCVASFDEKAHKESLNYFKNTLDVNVLNMEE